MKPIQSTVSRPNLMEFRSPHSFWVKVHFPIIITKCLVLIDMLVWINIRYVPFMKYQQTTEEVKAEESSMVKNNREEKGGKRLIIGFLSLKMKAINRGPAFSLGSSSVFCFVFFAEIFHLYDMMSTVHDVPDRGGG